MGFSFLIAAVLVVCIFYYLSKKQANDIKDQQITEEAFKYEKHGIGSILIVKKKSSIAASNLQVEAHREVFSKEVPDKIVYTGATVGGITTGGFHIQKGGTVYTEGNKTGKYSLYYRYASMLNNEPYSEVVSYLSLSDELMKEARVDPLLSKLIVTEEQQKNLEKLYHFNGRRNLLSLGDLNENTARSIKAWLGSVDDTSKLYSSNNFSTPSAKRPPAPAFNKNTTVANSINEMSEQFLAANRCETLVFNDQGISIIDTGNEHTRKRHYPYGSISKLNASFRIGVIIEITGKDTNSNGVHYYNKLHFNPVNDERTRLKNAIAFAQKKIRETQLEQ